MLLYQLCVNIFLLLTFKQFMKNKIREEMKQAMRKKESEKVIVLRSLLAAFTNELIAQKRPPTEELSDADITKAIKRAAKQRKDSIEQFIKGGRQELADKEQKELEIIKTYLPESASKEDIAKVVEAKITELGCAGDMSKMGILVGTVMKEFAGSADGSDVKEVVQKMLI
jgi:uncharacterized protein YqeY